MPKLTGFAFELTDSRIAPIKCSAVLSSHFAHFTSAGIDLSGVSSVSEAKGIYYFKELGIWPCYFMDLINFCRKCIQQVGKDTDA